MKKQLLLILMLGFASFSFGQTVVPEKENRITLHTGVGLQYYTGDLGAGIYKKTKDCSWGVISLGMDYKIKKSFDIKVLTTIGAMGYIQPEREHMEVGDHPHDHSAEHLHGVNPDTENLNARLTSGIVALQFRFANGCILKENSKFKPLVYLGLGMNYLSDPMGMECVNIGFYSTINSGVSLNYNITSAFSVGARFDFGYLTSDKMDFIISGANDLHMQNSIVLGFNL